jgi:hypothetical protein
MICNLNCQTYITFQIDSHLFYAILKYVKILAFSCCVAHIIQNALQTILADSSYHRLLAVDQESVKSQTSRLRQHWLDIDLSPYQMNNGGGSVV